MIHPIVKFGDPVLEKPAAPITVFDDELRQLVDDMFESMYAAHGVGLAATQIGISKRIAVIDVTFKEDPEAKIVLVNPEIIHVEGRITSNEGCLSLPEFREKVTRARSGDFLAKLRQAQAAFIGGDAPFNMDDLRIDQHDLGFGVFLESDIDDRDALADADLGSGEADAVGGIHALKHVVGQFEQFVIELGNRDARLLQDRVTVFDDGIDHLEVS